MGPSTISRFGSLSIYGPEIFAHDYEPQLERVLDPDHLELLMSKSPTVGAIFLQTLAVGRKMNRSANGRAGLTRSRN